MSLVGFIAINTDIKKLYSQLLTVNIYNINIVLCQAFPKNFSPQIATQSTFCFLYSSKEEAVLNCPNVCTYVTLGKSFIWERASEEFLVIIFKLYPKSVFAKQAKLLSMLTIEKLQSSTMRNNLLISELLTLMKAKAALKDHISGSITAASGGLPLYRLSLYFGRNYYDNALQKDVPSYCEVHKQQPQQLQIQPSGPNFVFLLHVYCQELRYAHTFFHPEGFWCLWVRHQTAYW